MRMNAKKAIKHTQENFLPIFLPPLFSKIR
jgi:hypothetical protein